MRAVLIGVFGLGLWLGLGSEAAAQPMMMDPSKMSGIPRPDPQVPAGTVTVRLIRGRLDQRMIGVDVALTGGDGKATTTKTDAEGRATFAGLSGGPFVASAKEADVELKSQPIALDAQMGTRVMLVFPLAGGKVGSPDGVAHPDKTLPAGTLVVRAQDPAGQALEGLEVVITQGRAGEKAMVQHKGKTDVAGEAKFDGLDRKPTSGYLVEVISNGAHFGSKPFRLEDNMGERVVLPIAVVSKDMSAISIADGSHLLVEITDDTIQIIQVFLLANSSTAAFDPGPEGLHLALPRKALQLQIPDNNPSLTISGHDVVYRGLVPPGQTQLRVAYALAYSGSTADFVEPTPIPFAKIALVTQPLEGLTVSGQQMFREEREMQGRTLWVYFGEGSEKDGELRITLGGLPHNDPMPRYIAAALSIALMIIFGIYATGGGGAQRARLERERRALFGQLVSIDGKLTTSGTADREALERERKKIVSQLSDVYRGLDELGT